MNINRFAVVVGLFCGLTAVAAAQSSPGDGGKGEIKQAVDGAKATAGEKKADFEKRIKAELDELDAKISELDKKISKMGEDHERTSRARASRTHDQLAQGSRKTGS